MTLILPAQQMPIVDAGGRCTVPWYQFFTSLATGQGSIGGLIVNPGGTTINRTLNEVLADLANVNDYLNSGDTNYDGAVGRCLAARGRAWFPNKPWLGGSTYPTSTTITLLSDQSLRGDGKNLSTIACQVPGTPTVTLGNQIFGLEISDIAITHGGATPTAGGDGIFQGQGVLDWVNDGVIRNVSFSGNYVGMNLGKAFFCRVDNCDAATNISRGAAMTSAGVSTVPSGAAGGPLQWYFKGCNFGSNGDDGAAYISTASTTTTISVGTFTDCTWFANLGYAVNALGNSHAGIYSVRVRGGFMGNDQKGEVHLDTFGNHHVITPDFIELAGNPGGAGVATACGINITPNNDMTYVQVSHINGCNAEGVLSQGTRTLIGPGFITNNGESNTATRENGVNFVGVPGYVVGATITDTGAGTQRIGVAGNTDGVQLIGCDLVGNITAPIALTGFGVGSTNQISGCLPLTINEIYTDTLHVYGAAAFVGAGGITGTLGITVLAGGLNFTTAIANNGITVDNIWARFSEGVGIAPTGTAGQLQVAGDLATVGTATTHLTASGGIAMSGGVTITSGGMNFTNTGTNGINAVDDLTVRRSAAVGASASGTSGRLDLGAGGGVVVGSPTGGFVANSINLTGSYLVNNVAAAGFSGAYTGNVVFTGNLTVTGSTTSASVVLPGATSGSASLSASNTGGTLLTGAIAISGASSLAGGLTITSGGIAITGGMNVDNIAMTGGMYNPAATGTFQGAGTINLAGLGGVSATSYFTNGTPITIP